MDGNGYWLNLLDIASTNYMAFFLGAHIKAHGRHGITAPIPEAPNANMKDHLA